MKAPWIIKAGGELVGDAAVRRKILRGLAEASRRNPVIFFHGGGPQIEAELKRNNVAAHFVGGRRVTTPAAMVHVERILSGEINKGLAGELLALGVRAAGLSCRDGGIVIGKPLPKLGRAAKPVKVKADLLWSLLKTRFTPVVSTVGGDAR
ncbi:MAG: acetylaminoadipate kinase, partial [Elusimicrobia bacterium]|nr:acetylaminoadipate kinase [Elusimicrobiota bacterium]